jgi:hypothetical protein
MGTCLPGHQGVSPRMTSQEIARAMEVTLRYLWTDDLDSPMFERGQTTSFKNLPDHSPFPAFHFEFVSNLRPVSLLSARSTL